MIKIGIKMMIRQDPEVRELSVNDLKLINEDLPLLNCKLYLACQFIFYCFIRPTELLRLRIRDVDLFRKIVIMRPEVSKNRKQDIVAIPDYFMEVLKKENLDKWPGDYFIFSTRLLPGKNPIEYNRLSKEWRKFADKVGLKRNLYDLKHTGAGKVLENGADVWDLMKQLRHSKLETTQIYLQKFRNVPSERLRQIFPKL